MSPELKEQIAAQRLIGLAHYKAKERVKLALRAKGIRLANVSCKEINVLAMEEFDTHKDELLEWALPVVMKNYAWLFVC